MYENGSGRWLQLLRVLETLIVLSVRVTLIVFSAFSYLRVIFTRFTSREQHDVRIFLMVVASAKDVITFVGVLGCTFNECALKPSH